MADGAGKAVYAALAGNALIAIGKFGAAADTGSSAILSEPAQEDAVPLPPLDGDELHD